MDADFQSQDVKAFRQWLLEELGGPAPDGKKQGSRPKLVQARPELMSVVSRNAEGPAELKITGPEE
jgi:hypothetical protein